MVHVIKVFLEAPESEKQIRRIAVGSEVVSKFELLHGKIVDLFPVLKGKSFEIGWKDSEGDLILMSSDGELAQSLANSEDGLIKVYATLKSVKQNASVGAQVSQSHEDLHPRAICDVCNKNICGYRYKCLQCKDYDLCTSCNAADKHPEHDMIKLVLPVYMPREWVFQGARKIWRSMFGQSPWNCERQNKKAGSSPKTEEYQNLHGGTAPWLDAVNHFLKGDFVQAEKLIHDSVGNFLNLADVEVKVGKCPFDKRPSPDQQPSKEGKNNETEEKEPKTSESTKPSSGDGNSTKNEVKDEEKAQPKFVADEVKCKAACDAESIHNTLGARPKVCGLFKNGVNEAPKREQKENSPTSDTIEGEAVSCADGWTLLNKDEADKKVSSTSEMSAEGTSQVKEETVCKPSPIENASVPEKIQVEEKEVPPQDAKVANALLKMRAMGFTNEGGWLERLLVTKQGNINEALDALYPNTQRH